VLKFSDSLGVAFKTGDEAEVSQRRGRPSPGLRRKTDRPARREEASTVLTSFFRA